MYWISFNYFTELSY